MFQNWGFLLGEIWGLILLAALLGLFAGWLIWNRTREILDLRGSVDAKDRELTQQASSFAALEGELNTERARFADFESEYATAISARDGALTDLQQTRARVTELEGEVEGVNTRIAGLQRDHEGAIEARDQAFVDLRGKESVIAGHESTITSLQARIAELQAKEAELSDAIKAKTKAQSDHAAETHRLRQRDTELASLKTKLADAETSGTRVVSLEADLASATAKAAMVAGLQSKLRTAEADAAKANGLRAELTARDRRIEELEAAAHANGNANARVQELERRLAASEAKSGQVAKLEADLSAARAQIAAARDETSDAAGLQTRLDACKQTVEARDAVIRDLKDQMNSAVRDYDGDGVIEGKDEGTKPMTLTAARGGKADDLKMIKGVGPKLEKLLHKLGFYHFDQVASWTADEVAWVDANLEGFNGRVSRDRWIEQAKILASGGTTEFAARVEDGDVYDK